MKVLREFQKYDTPFISLKIRRVIQELKVFQKSMEKNVIFFREALVRRTEVFF